MGRFVIVAYAPKPGKDQDLLAAVKKHLKVLKEKGWSPTVRRMS